MWIWNAEGVRREQTGEMGEIGEGIKNNGPCRLEFEVVGQWGSAGSLS